MNVKEALSKKDALQKVLLFTADRAIFDKSGVQHSRLLEMAKRMKELHVVVLCDNKNQAAVERIGDNVWIYATNSSFTFLRALDAWNIVQSQIVWKFRLWTNVIVSEQPQKTALLSYIISLIYRTRLVVYFEATDIYALSSLAASRNWLKKKIFIWLYERIMGRALSLRIPSEKTGDILSSIFPKAKEKTLVIPFFKTEQMTPPDARVANNPIVSIRTVYPQFNIIILSLCDFYSRKDILATFEIFATLQRRYPLAGLVMVGKYKPRSFDRAASRLNTKAVIYDSRIENLSSYFETANVFLMISKDERNSPLIIEAATRGAVMVTSNLTAAIDIISDGQSGKICSDSATETFSSSIISTLESPGTADLFRITIKDTMKGAFITDINHYSIYYKYFLKSVYIKD
jgi:glycosyltransferase involved in cell wall biosynthesis